MYRVFLLDRCALLKKLRRNGEFRSPCLDVLASDFLPSLDDGTPRLDCVSKTSFDFGYRDRFPNKSIFHPMPYTLPWCIVIWEGFNITRVSSTRFKKVLQTRRTRVQ